MRWVEVQLAQAAKVVWQKKVDGFQWEDGRELRYSQKALPDRERSLLLLLLLLLLLVATRPPLLPSAATPAARAAAALSRVPQLSQAALLRTRRFTISPVVRTITSISSGPTPESSSVALLPSASAAAPVPTPAAAPGPTPAGKSCSC